MEFKDQKAIYLQIADLICDRILGGEYAEGERLPSVRDVAADVEVNVNTVARSFEWLQTCEVAHTRRGLGCYVSVGAREVVERLRREAFFREQLPEFVRTMEALGITWGEVMHGVERPEHESEGGEETV